MTLSIRRAAFAAALLFSCVTSALAQTVTLPQVNNAGGAKVGAIGAVLINPDGTAVPLATAAATSTPASNAAITSPTTLAFTPQLGRPIRIIAKLTAGSSYDAQVTTSADGCTTKNPLTVAGQTWASYSGQTGPLNEDVDVPMISGISYCLTVTPGAGATVSAAVRQ